MKDKEKEVLLGKIAKLRAIINGYPHLQQEYPQLAAQVAALQKQVAYQEVLDKDSGLNLNKRQLEDLANFCEAIETFKGQMANIQNTSSDTKKFLTVEILKNGEKDIAAALEGLKAVSDTMFHAGIDKMVDYVNGLSSGISLGDMLAGLQRTILSEYDMIDAAAIKRTTSLKAVKEMKIPIFEDYFFTHYKKFYKGKPAINVPSAADVRTAVEAKYGTAYVMTPDDFKKDVGIWVDHLKNDISKLVSHQYAQCAVALDIIAADSFAQMGTLASQHKGIALLQVALNEIIIKSSGQDITKLGEFAGKMPGGLDKLKSITLTPDLLLDVYEADFFSKRLMSVVTLSATALKSVDTKSPYYIVGQPNFKANLLQKLNAWKNEYAAALGIAAKTVLELDGANFDAAKFKAVMVDGVSGLIPSVKNAVSGLVLQNLSLRGHTDTSSFDNQWNTPWRNMVAGINIDELAEAGGKVEVQAALFTRLYDLLPSQDDVLTAFLNCITGKVNLALEQAMANRNEMRAGFQQVNQRIDQVEAKVDNLQQDVNQIKQDVNQLKDDVNDLKEGQQKILKKLDELEFKGGDTNISIDINTAIEVDNLLDIVINPSENLNIDVIINKFLEHSTDKEHEFFKVDKNIPIASYAVFEVGVFFDFVFKAGLKHRKGQGMRIESTGSLAVEARAGLFLGAFSICGYSLAAIKAYVKAALEGKVTAALTAKSNTCIEGGLQAAVELSGTVGLEFTLLADTITVYTLEAEPYKFLVLKTPIYSISYELKSVWGFKAAAYKSGEYEADLHPMIKAALKKAKDALSNPMTYIKAGIKGVIYVAEVVGEFIVDAVDTVIDGVGTALSYVNPFSYF